mmetsp:Transcript_19508/g.56644  ORF Transcript_19508/g.56644 Transcript_19508/m.56644 type:complete len:259 (+) Transcript_19508:228-1004(+)
MERLHRQERHVLRPVDDHRAPADVHGRGARRQEAGARLVVRAGGEKRVTLLGLLALFLAGELEVPNYVEVRRPVGLLDESIRTERVYPLLHTCLLFEYPGEDLLRGIDLVPLLLGRARHLGPLVHLDVLPGPVHDGPDVRADERRVGLWQLPRPHQLLVGVRGQAALGLQADVDLGDVGHREVELGHVAERVREVELGPELHVGRHPLWQELLPRLAVDELLPHLLRDRVLAGQHRGKVTLLHRPHDVIHHHRRLDVR